MGKKITIDRAVLEQLGVAVRRFRHLDAGGQPSVFALDPGSGGSRPTGWCLIGTDGSITSGEGDPHVVVREAGAAIDILGRPHVFAREDTFTMSRSQMAEDETITPLTLYRMGIAAGVVTGGVDYGATDGIARLSAAAFWQPMPTTWRAVLGLNRRADGDTTARDATAEAVWLWARATTGLPLMTPGNRRRRIDQAMAIGIAVAALDVALEAERKLS